MVLLARGFWSTTPTRECHITDRDELDKQIERIFTRWAKPSCRTSSGSGLMRRSARPPRAVGVSLVHKFGAGVSKTSSLHQRLEAQPSPDDRRGFRLVGRVPTVPKWPSCNRTMKAMLPNAVFIVSRRRCFRRTGRGPAWKSLAATFTLQVQRAVESRW